MAFQTRREFMKTSSLVAASVPLRIAQEPSPTSPRKYRACEIGQRGDHGHMGGAFAEFPNVAVVAVANPDEKGRLQHARTVKASRTYADYREMLQKEKPDFVVIGPNRPTGLPVGRLEMIQAAAEAGTHVLVDKPHARSLEEADQMIALAEKHKIKGVTYNPVRVAPAVVHLKKLVDEGLIGDLLEIQVRGVEHLLHMGWHCIYLLRYFAGEPLWCSASVTQRGKEITAKDGRVDGWGLAAGDSIHASYAFAGGVQGHFVWQVRGPYQMTLYGSKGVVHFLITDDPAIYHFADPDWAPGKKSGAEWQRVEAPKNVQTGWRANVKRLAEELIRAVETDGQSAASLYEARGILEMLLAVYTSHLQGSRVSFPLKDRGHPLGALR